MAGNLTRINCSEGSYAHHYSTLAITNYTFYVPSRNVHLECRLQKVEEYETYMDLEKTSRCPCRAFSRRLELIYLYHFCQHLSANIPKWSKKEFKSCSIVVLKLTKTCQKVVQKLSKKSFTK
jgi:hypothetical protein